MASRSCVSGCGWFLTSSDGHDRCHSCLGFRHAEAALVDESCSLCGNMTIAMLRSRYLLARRGGIPLALPRSSFLRTEDYFGSGPGWFEDHSEELPRRVRLRGPLTPRAHRTVWGSRMSMRGPRTGRGPASHSCPSRWQLSITCIGGWARFWRGRFGCAASVRRVALPESDPELTAMLSRAAESIGLHYRRPPSPERSRRMIGSWGRRPNVGNRPRFRSSRKCMRRWLGLGRHLFLPEAGLVPPPSSPPSTAERPRGMWRSPQSMRAHCHAALPAGRCRLEGNPRLPVQGL